ncbi:cytochrome C [Betaproteobacteria bacterium SCGC AG-212-J23]|nr:cytochrome C [Betaproteobacteria bacterium SCGC AG-212-J23]
MRKLLLVGLFAPLAVFASEAGYPLDPSPHNPRDLVSVQAGARTFVNYCLGCHGAQYMRYQGLAALDLSEAQIRDNLMFTAEKIGEPMRSTMSAKDAKQWFGVAPPDLSVIARSRGADWLYTYLRTFYRDPKTATGWNNAVYPNVGMPHALWMLQGEKRLEVETPEEGHGHVAYKWSDASKGALSAAEYDATVRDLVNFLVYVSEPHAASRRAIGVITLFFLGVVFIFAYLLKKEFWKDVH